MRLRARTHLTVKLPPRALAVDCAAGEELRTEVSATFREEGVHEGNIQVVVFKHGWFWFIPFRGEITSVGMVVSSDWIKQRKKGESLDDFYDRTVAESSWAREFLSNATRQRPVGASARGHGNKVLKIVMMRTACGMTLFRVARPEDAREPARTALRPSLEP